MTTAKNLKRIVTNNMYCICEADGKKGLSLEALRSIENFKKEMRKKYGVDYK